MKKSRVHGPRKSGQISVPVVMEGLGAVFAPKKGAKSCGARVVRKGKGGK